MKRFVYGLFAVLVAVTLLIRPEFTYKAQAYTEMDIYQEAKAALQEVLVTKDIMALVYLTNEYTVREKPTQDSTEVIKVKSGQSVLIKGADLDEDLRLWVHVSFYLEDKEYTGYIERDYLACSDELFLQWESIFNPAKAMFGVMSLDLAEDDMTAGPDENAGNGTGDENTADTGTVENPEGNGEGDGKTEEVVSYPDIDAFPESYKTALLSLKKAHPNWVFVKMDTGLEWDTVVKEELYGGRSLIPTSLGGHLTEGRYSNGWSYPTREALEYYLDPRNGLTEEGIFQFELLSYNATYHEGSQAAVQSFLNNTFMSGKVPQWIETYAYAFWIIGKNMNISPFHLASRVYQEQGREGTSPLISGTYPGFEGYYNYFNIGASGSTDKQVIESGLTYAKNANPPWNAPYTSLHYGAKMLGSNYITKGQDTLYLQKFDVDASNNGMYWHQYMQNICAPSSEAKSIRKLYTEVGAVDNMFIFKIPVYNNMPESCPLPTESKKVILDVLDGYTEGTIHLDGKEYTAEKRNGFYIVDAPDFSAKIATMYQYNESGIPTGMRVWNLSTDGKSYSAKEITELKDLLSYHGFSIRITGKAGIRYKSGIAEETKAALIGEGLNGYKLKESGNLIMVNNNRGLYPMIKDGEKVISGMSYGVDKDGNLLDTVFETVNGRQRFTAVLVGLPAEQYKTEFAFRGYTILTKGEEEITIYGPIMYRSIYALAQQALSMNLYEEGSSAQLFLKQLITDADNLPVEVEGN